MLGSQICRLGANFCRSQILKTPRISLFVHQNSGLGKFNQKNLLSTGSTSYKDKVETEDPITTYLSSKYKVLSEENAPLILDLEAERNKLEQVEKLAATEDLEEQSDDEFVDLDLSRGVHGVYDIEQLVELLHSEGAIDLFVCEVPKELCYADQIVIVTGRSVRHRLAIAHLVRKIFKKKRDPSDVLPRIEGDGTATQADWLAMDLGNIILHVFSRAARQKYDLESLWCLGSKHDVLSNEKSNELLDLLTSSDSFIEDLEPAEPTVNSSLKEP